MKKSFQLTSRLIDQGVQDEAVENQLQIEHIQHKTRSKVFSGKKEKTRKGAEKSEEVKNQFTNYDYNGKWDTTQVDFYAQHEDQGKEQCII